MSEIIQLIKRDSKHFYYTRIKHLTDREIQQNHLRSLGMKIGDECYIFSDKIETAEPYLVSLGDHVTIANYVKLQPMMHQPTSISRVPVIYMVESA